MNNDFRGEVKEIFAFVYEHSDGNENVISIRRFNIEYPLLGTSIDWVKNLAPVALEVERIQGIKAKLVKFDARTELDIKDYL
ncbi:hypothetical protein [Vibrio pelagius]|uniref:hypothetical protein n=1 Tax=Vibrio pelagius TaxID=28169 RepID=UPI0035500986